MFKTNKEKQIVGYVVCTVLLIFLVLICLMSFNFAVQIAFANDLPSRESRLLEYIDEHIDGMNMEYKTNAVRKNVKTLYDFAGNIYLVVECSPTGYMIMCDDSATMIEYSGISDSPYLEYTENLYYAGPTFYYVEENGVFIHTITKELLDFKHTTTTRSAEYNNSVVDACNEMHDDLVSAANYEALNYINNGIKTRTVGIELYGEKWTCINNMLFFSGKISAEQIGYKSGGYCGYIAAAMLIGYYDTFVRDCMDDGWLYMTGEGVHRHFTGSGLTDRLFKFSPNGDNSSTSTTIRKTMNAYFNYYGYNLGSYDMITPFFSGTTFKNLVDNETPSILFGNLGSATDPYGPDNGNGGNHAVVVYGYKKGGTGGALYSLLVHYGWEGYSMSTINYRSYSVFGSMYRVTY